ncbi:hypothetical protein BDR05DRAFT_993260 [Suillus weaverae]|nr:hypothetical protein BDR05DRAFT_993260 [Suillus weaverae]
MRAVMSNAVPPINPPDHKGFAHVALEEGVKILEKAGKYRVLISHNDSDTTHSGKTHLVLQVPQSEERVGVDVLSINGFEYTPTSSFLSLATPSWPPPTPHGEYNVATINSLCEQLRVGQHQPLLQSTEVLHFPLPQLVTPGQAGHF